jgi:hypothetical protein
MWRFVLKRNTNIFLCPPCTEILDINYKVFCVVDGSTVSHIEGYVYSVIKVFHSLKPTIRFHPFSPL